MGPPAEAVSRISEADWVEAARYDLLVTGMCSTNGLMLVMIGMMSMLLYAYVPYWQLSTWMVAALAVTVLRLNYCRRFARLGGTQSIEARLSFARRNNWIWPLYGFVWVGSSFLVLDEVPPRLGGFCWMLIAGTAGVAVLRLSADLRVARMYLFAAIVALTASMGLHFLLGLGADQEYGFMLAAIMAAYLLVLFRVAAAQHEGHLRSIELHYHNERLIHSLKRQTRIEREAMIFKDRFLASAAHDLKQPVNALGIYAEWLTNEPQLSPELAPKILQAAKAVNTLFDSMFDLVKLDSGHYRVKLQPVDIPRLLSDLEIQFRPMATQKGLSLRVRPPVVTMVNSDPAILQRILGNLLTNSIRYTRQGGVLLAVRKEPQGLRFEVWDTGIGIPLVEQKRIFGEFYKVQSAGTEEGFGLGLTIVKRLAGLLGYRVSVRSRPDQGSVFCLHVPLDSP
ncbi:sensor histidine kinase [Ottowia caeni]|uniref:sensor histidine kinase n=1 Tax=Ottowia caeni TaxID=2870339 RepID=UPI001E341588|nr:HAMP domain-containing histidine kinase [Ottowia caeni]